MNVVSIESSVTRFEPGMLKHLVASHACEVDYEASGDIAPCMTNLGFVQFGSVCVFKHEGQGVRRGLRRLDHIRTDHVDDFLISMPVRGRSSFSQAGISTELVPGHFAILSTSKPFAISIASENWRSEFQQYTVRVSGPLLRARVPRIDEYCHNPVKISRGAGEIMASLCSLAMQQGDALSESQRRTFGGMLVDAIASTTREAPELLGLHSETRLSSYARIRDEAAHFIACHISNPALDPVMIATHCKISVSYLHAAFASASETIGSIIRETRLQRCRAALQSPDLRGRAVFEIALRWGFSDPAYFSRAYKARFGKAPREDRCIE